MKIKFTPRAESEAEAKKRWWHKNRHASPDLFDDELAGALDAIRRDPNMGAIHPSKHPAAPAWAEAVMKHGIQESRARARLDGRRADSAEQLEGAA